MATDPICQMTVDPSTALSAERDGETYYFCCDHCRKKFLEAGKASPPTAPEAPVAGNLYTCPMHPEVEQEGPGTCPQCGMALEPKYVVSPVGAARPGTPRHDATLLGGRGAGCARAGDCHGADGGCSARSLAGPRVRLAATAAEHAGRALGRLALLPARLAVARHRPSEHVHAHRPGHGRGLSLQRRGRSVPGTVPRIGLRRRASWACTSRRRPSSPRWCCWGRCWNCAPGAHGQRDPGTARPGAANRPPGRRDGAVRVVRWTRSGRATCCRSCPATRSPWTAVILEGPSAVDESMITGEPIPVEKSPGDRGDRRHGQPDRLVPHAGRARGPRHRAGPDRPDGGRGPAEPRADPARGRHGRGLLRSRWSRWWPWSRSSSGWRSGRSRDWPTPWSTPWPC